MQMYVVFIFVTQSQIDWPVLSVYGSAPLFVHMQNADFFMMPMASFRSLTHEEQRYSKKQ